MAKSLFLLSTDGCHLCNKAIEQLDLQGIGYDVLDIIEDDRLVAVYGEHIPVLIFEGASQALYWPFDAQQIKQYIDVYGTDSN